MQTPAQSREPPVSGVAAASGGRTAAPEPVAVVLQPLDYTSLRAVLSELRAALLPSRFEKAQQSDPCTMQLGLRTFAGSRWLELSWLAEAPRLLAIPPPPRQGEGSTLAQQLQHGLRGLALVELHQPAWERVAELRFAPRPGEPVERTLVLELMGRHSNLFLLDAERRVIALARQVRDSQSRLRPIGTGDPYQPPPCQAGEPPRLQEGFEVWRQRLTLLPLPLGKALLSAYQGTSPALVRQLLDEPGRAAPPVATSMAEMPTLEVSEADLPVGELREEQWQRLWQRWQAWLLALAQERFALNWGPQGTYRCWSAPEESQPPAASGRGGAGREPLQPGVLSQHVGAGVAGRGDLSASEGPASAGASPSGWAEADAAAAGARAKGAAPPGSSSGAADPVPASAAAGPEAPAIAAAGGSVVSRAAAGRGRASSAAVPGASAGVARPEGQPLCVPGTRGPGTGVSAARERAAELSINRALAFHFAGILSWRQWRQRRQALESRLCAALARERQQLEQQQLLLEGVPAADGLQRQADALLCLPDPDRDTIEQAQALYRRARKLRRSAAAITPRIALHEQRLAGLETSLIFLEQLDLQQPDLQQPDRQQPDPDHPDPHRPQTRPLESWHQAAEAPLVALEEELLEQLERLRPQGPSQRGGRARARRRQSGQADPCPLELRTASGLRLQVGRNHRQNEWISLRQARRGDLWFHAQEQPGSHVVLKGSEAPPGEADLQAAADLAAHFSRGRGNRRVPVLMVSVETLQRIPGAEPGTVRHRGGEVLWGEPERALALLRQGEPGGPSAAADRRPVRQAP